MGHPYYPERGYREDHEFGIYLHPNREDSHWGIVTEAGGAFKADKQLIPSNGRLLEEYGLVLITSGEGFLETTDSPRTSLCQGDLLVLLPGEWHCYGPTSKNGWSEMWLLFTGPVADSLRSTGRALTSQRAISLRRFSDWRSRFADIVNVLVHQEEFRNSLQGNLAARILPLLVDLRRLEVAPLEANTDTKIESMLHKLEEDLSQEVNWQSLANSIKLSASQFRRRFRLYTGESPHQYLINLRIKRAEEFLIRSSLPIEEIAAELGYAGSTQFARIFKSKTGLSPRSWRSRSRHEL